MKCMKKCKCKLHWLILFWFQYNKLFIFNEHIEHSSLFLILSFDDLRRNLNDVFLYSVKALYTNVSVTMVLIFCLS